MLLLLLLSCSDSPSLNTYHVTFDPSEGSLREGCEEIIAINEGMLVPEPEDPVRNGYWFAGWYTADGTKTPFDTANTSIEEQGINTLFAIFAVAGIAAIPCIHSFFQIPFFASLIISFVVFWSVPTGITVILGFLGFFSKDDNER